MSRASKVKIGSHWNKPPTKIYEYNYNFQEGYYRPMVDYLDKRDRGVQDEPPRAQTLAERIAAQRPNKDKQLLEGIPFQQHLSAIGSKYAGEPRSRLMDEDLLSPEMGFGDEDPFSRSRRTRSKRTPDAEAMNTEDIFGRSQSVGANARAEVDAMMQELGMEPKRTRNPSAGAGDVMRSQREVNSEYNADFSSTRRRNLETIAERGSQRY
ncbi:unnamed protein product [Cyprideis torosa]|uniref:Uncharacterized protein n=1 Tax=Cyprideis torosa TaxID=163714 RepID=A0A7R8W221_9CRUS|nr:unnamed protein product [Cyprideis torosa]CAG0879324.1 unnamed protein product [Cyprideis torosa]